MKFGSAFLIAGCICACAALGQMALAQQAGPSDMRDVLAVLRVDAPSSLWMLSSARI